MPKQKITKELIMKAGFSLVRKKGYEAVNARSVANAAGCSVQPIYSCYANMEQLMEELFDHCRGYQLDYVRSHLDAANYFGSSGRAHISFAQEERELFKFIFLSKYVKGTAVEDIYAQYGLQEVTDSIEATLGLSKDKAKRFYLDMMIYTHGIAAMVAAGGMSLSFENIHENVDRAYNAFLTQAKENER